MEITKKEFDNMSPEQMAEVQKQQCIFCHIVAGKVASKKVFEDESCIGILDINPANPGHILLIPKKHFQIMPQLPDDLIGHMFMVAKHLSQAALKALQVGGVNIVIANGIAAGQRAPHFMIHIIPRTENDGLNFVVPARQVAEKDMILLKQKIKPRINKLFGIEEIEPVNLDKKPQVVDAEFEDEVQVSNEEEMTEEQETEEQESEISEEQETKALEIEEHTEPDEESEQEQKKPDVKADLDKISELFS